MFTTTLNAIQEVQAKIVCQIRTKCRIEATCTHELTQVQNFENMDQLAKTSQNIGPQYPATATVGPFVQYVLTSAKQKTHPFIRTASSKPEMAADLYIF